MYMSSYAQQNIPLEKQDNIIVLLVPVFKFLWHDVHV